MSLTQPNSYCWCHQSNIQLGIQESVSFTILQLKCPLEQMCKIHPCSRQCWKGLFSPAAVPQFHQVKRHVPGSEKTAENSERKGRGDHQSHLHWLKAYNVSRNCFVYLVLFHYNLISGMFYFAPFFYWALTILHYITLYPNVVFYFQQA